jgi:hypothetical protein
MSRRGSPRSGHAKYWYAMEAAPACSQGAWSQAVHRWLFYFFFSRFARSLDVVLSPIGHSARPRKGLGLATLT